MKHLIHLSWLLLVLTACQSQEMPDDVMAMTETALDVEQLQGIEHDIAVNILANRYGGYQKNGKATRTLNDFTLTPLTIEGDTSLYVVQVHDYKSHEISMNWGAASGRFDHIFQSPNSAWAMGETLYDLDHKIIISK